MEQLASSDVRKEFAALFLFAVLAVVPVLMLLWGRVGGDGRTPANQTVAAPPADGATELIPPEGAVWAADLTQADGAYLMGLFFDSLAALVGPEESAEAAARNPEVPPPACVRAAGAPTFVTVYAAGTPSIRVIAHEESLADSVQEAARLVVERSGANLRPEALRVRIDVLREARSFPVEKRLAFAQRGFGRALGLAAGRGAGMRFFLPADIADYRAGTHQAMLHVICRQAGLGPTTWRLPSLPMWRLEAAGFVNGAAGSRYALPSRRGLTPLGELTLAKLLRAGRLGAQYLVRAQREDGAFLTYQNPASGLKGGCDSVPEQAAAAAALGALCELRARREYMTACYNALSYLMQFTEPDPANPRMWFTRRQEVCRVVWELEASAQVLEALCRYRRTSGLAEPDAWIAAMAEFLIFMQRDDGLFDLKYDVETGARTMPRVGVGKAAPQAKAALALILSFRELEAPKYLVAARRALDGLREQDGPRGGSYEPHEARWLASALLEANAFLPAEDYPAWASGIAAARRKSQLGPGEAPAEDLVGGTLTRFPPMAGPTADDLVVFASAYMMNPLEEAESLAAARRAAAYLMQLQYLPENSYYLQDPDAGSGGFREQPGSNIIRLQTLETALRGLVLLTRLELQHIESND